MQDLDVIDEPGAAVAVLEPLRARILAALVEPGSATTLATTLGQSRQKVNYHLKTLEQHGLVELVEERQRRGLTERRYVASAGSYALAPDLLGDSAVTRGRVDRLSSRYLIAIAARLMRDVERLARAADRSGKSLATLTIESEVRFASASRRAAFTEELTNAVAEIVARHHDEASPGGRWHRLVVAAHPDTPHEETHADKDAPT